MIRKELGTAPNRAYLASCLRHFAQIPLLGTSDMLGNVKRRKEFAAKFGGAEQSPAKAGLDKLEIVRNGRLAVPDGGGWRAKISAAVSKISSNFFERTPPVLLEG